MNDSSPPDQNQSDAAILEWLEREYETPFEGWDFSHLDGRRIFFSGPAWDYEAILLKAMRASQTTLEVDTGGGERLAHLLSQGNFSGRLCATEGYAPNIPLARRRLEALGVEVFEVADTRAMPFDDHSFDLIMNRHGAFNLVEEFRLLRPGGALITQQVGNSANVEIHQLLGHPPPPASPLGSLASTRRAAEEVGFRVVHAGESYPLTQYVDLGALVYYLKCVPWTVPDFSVARYADRLLALHRKVCAGELELDVGFHYYLLAVQKPGCPGLLVP